MRALLELARRLQEKLSFEDMLTTVVTQAAAALECPHVSLRLLDASRTRLLVTARASRDVQSRGDATFSIGEGLVGTVASRAEVVRTGDATRDPRFVLRPGTTRPFHSFLGVPLVASGVCIGVLSAIDERADRFADADEDVLTLVSAICTPHLESARLARLACHDPLTGVLNRRGFTEILLREHPLVPPAAVAMADIDRFKVVNDVHGHAVGDEVLRHVAIRLEDGVRTSDGLVRWGGEEFLLVIAGVAGTDAGAIAERARERVRAVPAATAAGDVGVTVSIGVTSVRAAEPVEAAIDRADRALYRAKTEGRDRVVVAD